MGLQGPRGAGTPASRGRGAGRPLAQDACRELIRPLARGRHRNHSTAPAAGARGNGPAALTSPDSAAGGDGRQAPSGRAGPGARRVGGRDGADPARGGAVTGSPPPPPARPAGADSSVSLGLSNCPAARRPPFPETAAGPGWGGGVGWPRLPDAGVPPRAGFVPRASGWTRPLGGRERQPALPLPAPAPGHTAPCGRRAWP